MSKSCFGCPSLLSKDDSSFFRKSLGVPTCARFGKPVGTIKSSPEEMRKIAEAIGSTCSSHGEPRPSSPDWSEADFQVAFPTVRPLPAPADNLVNTCATCMWFIPDMKVVGELGWSSGLCAAKGKLILSNRQTREAARCETRKIATFAPVGFPETLLGELIMLPEYDIDFGSKSTVKAVKKAMENAVDPTEYETDRPVEPEDENRIRAWRKITDDETGNSVHLPIFRRDFFPADQQELIPKTGDDEHPEDYVDHNGYTYKVAVLWTELDETPAFWGKAGTGKTEFFRHMAWLMQAPFHRFSITGSSELDDLAGKMMFTEGVGTHFQKGRMVKAWESACVMVVDEPNAGPPDVWQFLRPMTDNSKQLVLDQSQGERSTRDVDCYLGMAMNPSWDLLNVGTQVLADADANRLMHIYVDLPPEELEREIIKKRVEHDNWEIPVEKLDMVMAIAKDVRALAENGTLPISWAIRPQLKVARALRWFDVRTAYRMASGDYLEPEQQAALMDVVNTHVADTPFNASDPVPF